MRYRRILRPELLQELDNLGLPIIEFKGIKKNVKEGDELEVDLHAGEIKNLTTEEDPEVHSASGFPAGYPRGRGLGTLHQ